MGIEKSMDLRPLLQSKVEQAVQSAAGCGIDVDLNVNAKVRTLDMPNLPAAAPTGYPGQTPDQADAQAKRFMFSDTSPVAGSYPNPMATPADGRGARANEMWGGIQNQGALYTMRELQSGNFESWMPHLSGSAREQASEMARGAGRKDGHIISESAEGMEGAGKKIFTLMQQIEAAGHGTPAAAKAAEQVAKLVGYIDRLGESAGAAADRIGGEAGKAAKEELKDLEGRAIGGLKVGDPKPGGGVWSAGEVAMMVHDPIGGSMQMAQASLFQKIAAGMSADTLGGAFSAMGGGAMGASGIVGAAGAGLYAGSQIPFWLDDKMVQGVEKDLSLILRDHRTSRMFGGGFDIRGATTDKDNRRTPTHPDIDRENLAQGISSLGITFGGSKLSELDIYRGIDKGMMRRDDEFGLAKGSLGSFLGQEVRSGALQRDDFLSGVDRLAGFLESANKIGISSNEKMSSLAAVNQMAASQMGFVSSETEHYLQKFQSFLDATGLAGLRGGQGVKMMSEATGSLSNEGQATVYAKLQRMTPAQLDAFGAKHIGSGWASAKAGANNDHNALAIALSKLPDVRLDAETELLNGSFGKINPMVQGHWLGLQDPSSIQAYQTLSAFKGATRGAVDNMGVPVSFESGVRGVNQDSAAMSVLQAEGELAKVADTTRKVNEEFVNFHAGLKNMTEWLREVTNDRQIKAGAWETLRETPVGKSFHALSYSPAWEMANGRWPTFNVFRDVFRKDAPPQK